MGGACSAHGIREKCICFGRKKLLGIPRHRWKNNINVDHKVLEQEVMDWIDLAQDRCQWHTVVNMAPRLRVP
jgi:hypothetical protein